MNWGHQTSIFDPFTPKLLEIIDTFSQDFLYPLLKGHPEKSWEKMVNLMANRIRYQI